MKIRMDFEDGIGPGVGMVIEAGFTNTNPSDADIIELAQLIEGSDVLLNHSAQWGGTPSLTSVGIDETRPVYP